MTDSAFRLDADHDVMIVIPTIGKPDVLLPSVERLLNHLDGLRVHIVVALNHLREEDHIKTLRGVRAAWERAGFDANVIMDRLRGWEERPGTPDRLSGSPVILTIYDHGEACGFGGAINRGLRAGIWRSGITPLTVIFNDDLVVTDGWLLGMRSALESATVCDFSESPTENGRRPTRSMQDYLGNKPLPGIVGPVTNVAAGMQVIGEQHAAKFRKLGVDDFAAWWGRENRGQVYSANFLSGYCMGFSQPFLVDMLGVSLREQGEAALFDERYLIAGYEDNDLCARAEARGWRSVIAVDTFIGHLGHQTFDSEFPGMERGMRNRLTYYDVWRKTRLPGKHQKLVAVYRVRFDVPHDLMMMRASLASIGRVADGIAVLLTSSLGRIRDNSEWRAMVEQKAVPTDIRDLVTAAIRSPSSETRALSEWVVRWATAMDGHRSPKVVVDRWKGEFNERDERNHAIHLGEALGADWILSVDHDEALEPRITRPHLDRLMQHPDPMVQAWGFTWANHWESTRWCNITPPWGDGGTFRGGMSGYRLFRVNKANPGRILAGGTNGLHCGNVPQSDLVSKRICNMRFRHYGYMRHEDRVRKLGRYNEQDPTPNPMLVGGTTYGHITHEENQLMSAFSETDGIGIHMLVYERERADDVGAMLDQVYGLADRIVLVWTGEWAEEDKRALYREPEPFSPGNPRGTMRPRVRDWLWEAPDEEWPATGPGQEMARMAEHFGAEWVHEPLADHLANARNAALEALHGTPGMGWALFFDPDEQIHDHATMLALRRMADATDCWGWLLRFRNPHQDGSWNVSESVRMSRLDSEGIMRLDGRVHESFDLATQRLVAEGYGHVIRVAPEDAWIINRGLAGTPEAMVAKLDLYRRLTELDLAEDPNNARAWTTLGLYWLNFGAQQTAMECFARGMVVAKKGQYLPAYQAGMQHLRLAARCMTEAAEHQGHTPKRVLTDQILEVLDQVADELPILGDGRIADDEWAMSTLPPWTQGDDDAGR